ncbi:hypothetical protein FRC06_006617 [Ceratobasidium sp. 370]|nr:hypothetical protein FRC06_006617 [Ceratobasidium sp. 370]
MALNPSIQYEWIDENWLPEQAEMLGKLLSIIDANPTLLASSQSTRLPALSPSSSTISTLNRATIELERKKFVDIPVLQAQQLKKGLSALKYWMAQSKSSEVPPIYRVALDILPAQAFSVSSERDFSSSKLTCTQLRNEISTHNVEALRLNPEISCGREPYSLDFMSHHDDELSGDAVIWTVD